MAVKKPRSGGAKPQPIDLEKVKELARLGCTEEAIARCFGFNPNYWYTDLKQSRPDLAEAVKLGRAEGQRHMLTKLLEQADKGNLAAIIFSLKSQHGFRDNQQIELTGANGQALTVEHVLMPPEERKKKIEELKMLEAAEVEDV